MNDTHTTVEELRDLLRRFVDERDWRQFHSPKNLTMALAIEVAELMEHFQWIDGEASRAVAGDEAKKTAVAEELADVIGYALAIANELEIDVSSSMKAKMKKNEQKYPVEKYRGWYERPARGQS